VSRTRRRRALAIKIESSLLEGKVQDVRHEPYVTSAENRLLQSTSSKKNLILPPANGGRKTIVGPLQRITTGSSGKGTGLTMDGP